MNTPSNQTAVQSTSAQASSDAGASADESADKQPTQNPALKTQPSMLPKDIIDPIEKEAQAIWHITELLSKLESPDDDSITLTTATLHHISKQISNHVSNIVESVALLDVE